LDSTDTKETAIDKCLPLLEVNQAKSVADEDSIKIYSFIKQERNNPKLDKSFLKVSFSSPKIEFYQSEYSGNINLFFYDNLLIGINITWNLQANKATLLAKATSQYGQPVIIYDVPDSYWNANKWDKEDIQRLGVTEWQKRKTRTVYFFKTEQKYIYLVNTDLFIIDRNKFDFVIKTIKEAEQKKINDQKIKDENEKKSVDQNIKF